MSVTIRELSDAAGRSIRTINRWEKAGKIPRRTVQGVDGGRGRRGVWDDSVLNTVRGLASATTQAMSAPPVVKRKKDTQWAPRKSDLWNMLIHFSGIQQHTDPILTYETARKAGVEYRYTYGLFEEALDKDMHLSAVMLQRKMAVISRDMKVLPGLPTKMGKYAAGFIQEVLDSISMECGDAGFRRDLTEILDAIPMGIAISEIVWESRDISFIPDGYATDMPLSRRGAFVPRSLMSRAPRRFGFDVNDQLLLEKLSAPDGVPLPPRKFLLFRPYTRHEDPHGLPAMRLVWWATWFKRTITQWWLKYLERFGDPLVFFTPEAALPDSEKAAMDAAMANIQQQTAMRLPPGVKAAFLEAQRYGTVASYEGFIRYLNMEMTKAILGQTTTLDSPGDGNRATGEVTQQVSLALTQQDARAMEALVNGTLIRWIMDFNLPSYPYPKFKIDTDPPKDLFGQVKIDRNLWEMGVKIPTRYIEQTYGVPTAGEGEETLMPQQQSGEKRPGRVPPAKQSTAPKGKSNVKSKTSSRST